MISSPSSLLDLIDGTTEQYEAWTRRGIVTPEELLYAVARHSNERRGVASPPRKDVTVVQKRDLLLFLNDACHGLRFDFGLCRTSNLLRFGGVFPEQWVALPKPGTRQEGSATIPRKSLSLPKHDTILYVPDPPPQQHSKEATAKRDDVDLEQDAVLAQEDLLCPITLEVFVDPVCTVHGTTYERTAIEDWFGKHTTDPLTGERLPTTLVWPNDAMRERVRLSLHKG